MKREKYHQNTGLIRLGFPPHKYTYSVFKLKLKFKLNSFAIVFKLKSSIFR